MRRFACLAAMLVVGVLAVGASTGGAYIPSPQAPGNWGSLTGCISNGAVHATGDGVFNTGDYLRIAWGNNTEAQSYNFLDAVSGTITVSGTNGTQTFTVAPGTSTGPNSVWTQPVLQAAPGNTLNAGKPIWFTAAFFQVNLPAGTYTINGSFQNSKTLNDGQNVIKANSTWFSTSGCTLVVQ